MSSAQGPAPTRHDAARAALEAIRAYAPASLSAEAAGFARAVVRRAAPGTPGRAKALLYAAGRLARFGESVGLEPEAETLLGEATIERFVLTGCPTVSPATRRTLRTNRGCDAAAAKRPALPPGCAQRPRSGLRAPRRRRGRRRRPAPSRLREGA